MGFKIVMLAIAIVSVLVYSGFTMHVSAQTDTIQIPDWIKGVANFWSLDEISDGEFVNALEFLIKAKVIQSTEISVLDEGSLEYLDETSEVVIPDWIKFNAQVWSEGAISDSDFIEGIKFMITEGIISSPNIQIVDPSTTEETTPEVPTDSPPVPTGVEAYDKLLELSLNLVEKKSTSTEDDAMMVEEQFEELETDELIAALTDPETDSDLDGLSDVDETNGTLGYVTDPNNADTDGDGLNDLREYWWNTNPTDKDTNNDFILDGESITDPELRVFPYLDLDKSKDVDEDGIPTAAERFDVGTDFRDYSTDGDRYDDGMEFFFISTKNDFLPSYVPADPFSPATPDIRITINPDVKFWPGTTLTIGKMDSQTDSYIVSSSEENTDSYSVGLSASLTATATLSTNLVNNEASLTAEVVADTEMRSTSTFTQSEESRLVTATEAYSLSETTLGESTTLQMWFTIENVGDDLLTDSLTEVMFNFYLGDDKLPFHTESFAETAGALTSFTNLEPGETVIITIQGIPLNLEQAMRFLANEGVRVEAEHYSFGEDQVYFINAQSSNLQLVLISEDGIDSRYMQLPETMNLEQVLETANIDYLRDENGTFTSIGNMESQTEEVPYKTISIYHTPDPNAAYSPPSNVDDMFFKNGDILVIKNLIDTDGDLLYDLDELKLGTSKTDVDTDGDGLWDGFYSPDEVIDDMIISSARAEKTTFCDETQETTTHPLIADTDGDHVNDGDEVTNGTDPCKWQSSILLVNDRLWSDVRNTSDRLVSPSGEFRVIMQGDSNLVVYQGSEYKWASFTPPGTGPYNLVMQGDGNLVLYQADGKYLWASNTRHIGNGPYIAQMQDDGNFVVYGNANPGAAWKAVWSSGTGVIPQ